MSLGAATTAAAAVTAEDADRGPFWLKRVRVVVERGHPGSRDTTTTYEWTMQ